NKEVELKGKSSQLRVSKLRRDRKGNYHNLIDYYLSYSIFKRIIAQEALKHEWFREVPLPMSKDCLPRVPAHHAHDRQGNDESSSLREATSQGIAT
ncbi:hypothetical protein Tco_1269260, partial [Tanacetum coccineum]